MMELTCSPLAEASKDLVCSSNLVQTFSAGPICKLLTKNAIFQSPEEDGSIFVCAGDEASTSALVSFVLFSVVVWWWVLLAFLGDKPYQSQYQWFLVGMALSCTSPCPGWAVILAVAGLIF